MVSLWNKSADPPTNSLDTSNPISNRDTIASAQNGITPLADFPLSVLTPTIHGTLCADTSVMNASTISSGYVLGNYGEIDGEGSGGDSGAITSICLSEGGLPGETGPGLTSTGV